MTPHQAFEAAVATAQAVIDQSPITDDDLHRPTPCRDFDVAALGDHLIDTHHFLLTAAGGSAVDAGGSLAERHRAVGAASVERWANRGTDGSVDLGGNELPASFGLSLHTLETYVHGWDLARGLGRAFEPPAELTDVAWEIAQQIVSDDLRGDDGPYGPAVDVDDGADLVDRIVAHTGRDPHQSTHPSRRARGEHHV
jgi:uncharacterized protein (TIGR03086 family)